MNSSLMWITGGYLGSIFLFLNQNNLLFFWCILEINMILLISMFYFMKGNDSMMNSEHCMYYFIVQSLGSFLVLVSLKSSSFFLEGLSEFIFTFSLILKMGVWPLYAWIYRLSLSLSPKKMFVLLSIQKIPLMFVMFSFPGQLTYTILFCSFVSGAYMMYCFSSVTELMVSSSIYSTIWVGYLFNLSLYFFIIYFLMYSFFLYFILSSYPGFMGVIYFFSFLFFMGLPPLSLFFFKVSLVAWIMENLSVLDFLSFWVISFLGLFGYFKFFYQYFLQKLFMYLNNEIFHEKMYISLMPCTFFLLFLI